MPIQPTYPGVYIEELPSGVHTITGVATSITAFIGRALRGPVNKAMTIESYADFERIYGGLWLESTLGYAVQDFFNNGGSTAVMVRLFSPTDADLQAARTIAQDIANVPDPVAPSTPTTLLAAMQKIADSASTVATIKAAQGVISAAQAAAAQIASSAANAVREAASATADALNLAAQVVAGTEDQSAGATAQSTAQAMRGAVAANDPDKTAGDIVAKAAETAAAKAKATIADVKKAATDAATKLAADLQTVTGAADPTNPPTAQSTAQAIQQAANAVPALNNAAAELVATAAQAEATNQSDPTPVREAANTAATEYIRTLPVTRATLSVGGMPLMAASQGSWGANLRVTIDNKNITQDVADNLNAPQGNLFNITIADISPGGLKEQFPTVTVIDHPRRIDRVLAAQSQLLRWGKFDLDGNPVPPAVGDMPPFPGPSTMLSDTVTTAEQALTDAKNQLRTDRILRKDTTADQALVNQRQDDVDQARRDLLAISDGNPISENEFTGPGTAEKKWGLFALEQVDLFNLLCIPPYISTTPTDWDIDDTLISDAVVYCEKRRALLLVDAPSTWINKDTAKDKFTNPTGNDIVSTRSKNAALFFPRVKHPNILRNNQVETFVASGVIAGIFARTDAQRGVWKAPAGLEASLVGVQQLSVSLTDAENGELNPLGINCLRAFPIFGSVVWGSRTLRGADAFADDYKYIPVRRTALFIEESLYRGTKWVVFEPNDEPLWAQIRLNIGAFMHNLFRQGAFQGQTPRDAYLVKCDHETTTQNDIDLGIVNILVAFAPLKPAEFVIIQIQQLAGQIQV